MALDCKRSVIRLFNISTSCDGAFSSQKNADSSYKLGLLPLLYNHYECYVFIMLSKQYFLTFKNVSQLKASKTLPVCAHCIELNPQFCCYYSLQFVHFVAFA